jgi:acyl-CoA thioesterase FadM
MNTPYGIGREPIRNLTLAVGHSRREGSNIGTWVGFKHFMYLAEEAVFDWFRAQGLGAHQLYDAFGAGLSTVDHSAQLSVTLFVDDEVTAEVAPLKSGQFEVTLTVQRDGVPTVAQRSKITMRLRPGAAGARLPAEVLALAPLLGWAAPQPPPQVEAPNALLWSWVARYMYCHYSAGVQHSGYVRALEEAFDRYVAERGLSVGTVLRERGWIPVVSRARVQILAEAHMEETIHTTFAVEDVIKRMMYSARMQCFVQRGGALVHTATAHILHGYAAVRGTEGKMVEIDDATIARLTGTR